MLVTHSAGMEHLMFDSPRNCVKLRQSGGDWVTMVGYDAEGEIQIEVRIRRARVSSRWEAWMLRWLKGWQGERLTLVK